MLRLKAREICISEEKINWAKLTVIERLRKTERKRDIFTFDHSIRIMFGFDSTCSNSLGESVLSGTRDHIMGLNEGFICSILLTFSFRTLITAAL